MMYKKLVMLTAITSLVVSVGYHTKPIDESLLSELQGRKEETGKTEQKTVEKTKVMIKCLSSSTNKYLNRYICDAGIASLIGVETDEKIDITDAIDNDSLIVTDGDITEFVGKYDTIEKYAYGTVILYAPQEYKLADGGISLTKELIAKDGINKGRITFKTLLDYLDNTSINNRKVKIFVPSENSIYREDVRFYIANNLYTLENDKITTSKEELEKAGYLKKADNILSKCSYVDDNELKTKVSKLADIFILPEYAATYMPNDSSTTSYLSGIHLDNTVRRNLYLIYNKDSEKAKYALNKIDNVYIDNIGYRDNVHSTILNSVLKHSETYKEASISLN